MGLGMGMGMFYNTNKVEMPPMCTAHPLSPVNVLLKRGSFPNPVTLASMQEESPCVHPFERHTLGTASPVCAGGQFLRPF